MKKWLIIMLALFVFVGIGKIRVIDPYYAGEDNMLHLNLINDGEDDLTGSKVRIIFPELGLVYQTNPFTLYDDSKQGKLIPLELPADTLAGDYLMRISFTNDDTRVIRHRWVTVV